MSNVPQQDELKQDLRDTVLYLTINRPERRNAINGAVLDGIKSAILQAGNDPAVRAVVITGAGDQAFCAGADLNSGTSFQFDYAQPQQALADLFRAVRRVNLPLIARVNGACMAGGMGLLAMCDFAVATPEARFGLPEVKVGVFPAQVISVLQPLISKRLLTELCITGEPIDADQALEAGLVNYVDRDLDGRIAWLLNRMLDKSPAAIRRAMYTLKHVESLPFEASIAFAESQIGLVALTDDAKEGQAAFREKRKPQWTGR